MGAGRTIKQDVVRIDEAIESGEFSKNKAILLAIDNAKKNNKACIFWDFVQMVGFMQK